MRSIATIAAVLFMATTCVAADEPTKATRVIEGSKTTLPDKSIADGVKLLTAVLESCHSRSDGTIRYTAQDVTVARQGDHVRFVLAKPITVEVLNVRIKMSAAVFANGVFWLVCGNEVVRCTKYEFDKMKPFEEWYRQTLPAD
ncbi:MAG TPA: hypothetical protein VHR66_14480 [Gemmataceae bacterium]|nr:hypothetical protein [Gemmataceae bacterium]